MTRQYRNRKTTVILTGLTLAAGLWLSRADASIKGSVHDFSSKTWNASGEICVVCHTPHNAIDSTIPLWTHKSTQATFTVYNSNTFNALNAKIEQPSGVSLACLSCHDGTVAIDSYGGKTGNEFITGTKLLGTDLSNDHPISFTYDTALATVSGDLQDPATAGSGVGTTIQKDLLRNNKVECSSCHDVHNGSNTNKLLVKGNAASALCLTCHKK